METDNSPIVDQPAEPKSKRRWFQYSLRTLLIFVTLCAVACSWFGIKLQQARKQRHAVEELKKFGYHVVYDRELVEDGRLFLQKKSKAPQWLQNLLGVDFFRDVTMVVQDEPQLADARIKITDAGMVHLRKFPHLQSVSLLAAPVSDAGLENLKELTELKEIQIWTIEYKGHITDTGLAHLKELQQLVYLSLVNQQIKGDGLENLKNMSQLESIDLQYNKITDAGLENLKGLSRLKFINLQYNKITDAGISHLKGLKNLKQLILTDDCITDAGLIDLKEMTQLEEFSFTSDLVTEAGIKDMQKALPKLNLDHYSGDITPPPLPQVCSPGAK
jgi:hypothetical protein